MGTALQLEFQKAPPREIDDLEAAADRVVELFRRRMREGQIDCHELHALKRVADRLLPVFVYGCLNQKAAGKCPDGASVQAIRVEFGPRKES